jgi:hypothetical protein
MASKSGRKAQSTSTRRTNKKGPASHPYAEHMSTELWRIIQKGIEDLVNNHDLEVNTSREYVVGYLCKLVSKHVR